MATWRWHFKGIKVSGLDERGWPITAIGSETADYTGRNIVLVEHEGLTQCLEAVFDKHLFGAIPQGFERVDKKTDYGFIQYPLAEEIPTITLPNDLINRVKSLQRTIKNRLKAAFEKNLDFKAVKLLDYDVRLYSVIPGVAQFESYGDWYASHEQAKAIIQSLTLFYETVSPDQLIILNADPDLLSHEEIEAIRRYDKELNNER